jgi:Bacterial dnaA protein helix-turn-helix
MTPLRARLMNPPNAVADTGINMKNGWTIPRNSIPYQPCLWRTPQITLIREFKPLPVPKPPSDIPPGYLKPKATGILVINETCTAWGIPSYKLLSDLRITSVVQPRHAAMAIIRRLTPLSLPGVGRIFGGRDHTTIVNAVRKMADHIAALNQELNDWSTPAEWVRAMKARLEA